MAEQNSSTLILSDQHQYSLFPYVQFLEDSSSQLDIQEIASAEYSHQFSHMESESGNFGVTDSSYWFRFEIAAGRVNDNQWMLYLRYNLIDELLLYKSSYDGFQLLYTTGLGKPWMNRPIDDTAFILPLELSQQVTTYYLKIQNHGSLQVPLSIWQADSLQLHRNRNHWWLGLYYGGLLAMLLYNLFIGFSTGERSYWFYVGYIACLLVAMAFYDGYVQQIFPSLPARVAYEGINWSIAAVLLFAYLFARDFLQLKFHSVWLEKISWVSISFSLLFLLFAVFIGALAGAFIILGLTGWFLLIMITSGLVSWSHNVPNARFFVVAWLAMVVGSGFSTLMHFGLMPAWPIVHYGVHLGTGGEALLLSLALANRINLMKRLQIETSEKAKKALELSNQQLQKSLKIKDEFLSLLSHELRTPLQGIVGGLKLIEQKAEFLPAIDLMTNASNEMLTHIEKLILYSELHSGYFKPHSSNFDLSEFLGKITTKFKMECASKGLNFSFLRSQSVPEWIYCDKKVLYILLDSLLENAVKFTRSGEIKLLVKQTLNQTGTVIFTIEDTGYGFDTASQKRRYKPFDVSNIENRNTSGLGIGLALCQQLTESVNGHLTFNSEIDVGTSIQLHWPVENSIEQKDNPLSSPLENFDDFYCLIVEDNQVNQIVLSGYLTSMNLSHCVVSNGQEAINFLKQKQADIVLMDCHMPILNGIECTLIIRQLNQSCAQIPIVAITADATNHNREICLQVGMNDVLFKPLSFNKLKLSIGYWLSHCDRDLSLP